tara:strand:+ start:900 stop:1745 length:846 start_codon:yes stop_codon:yes gene_type:complete
MIDKKIIKTDYELIPLEKKNVSNRKTPLNLPKTHFNIAVCGKTGSGKTYTTINMIKSYENKNTFNKMILICPSTNYDMKYNNINWTDKYEDFNDDILEEIIEQQKQDIEDHKKEKEIIKIYNKFINNKKLTENEIFRLYEEQYDIYSGELNEPFLTYDTEPYLLILLDDFGGEMKSYNNSFLNKIVCRSRHINTNFIILIQHIYQLPRVVRNQLSHLLLFKTKDKKILKEISKENSNNLTEDDFIELFEYATEKPYDFFYCDFSNNEYRKNFNEKINIIDK